jgi:transcription termination factor Rho
MPDEPAQVDLERKSLAELHALAAELGVAGFRALRREELIEAIAGRESVADGPARGVVRELPPAPSWAAEDDTAAEEPDSELDSEPDSEPDSEAELQAGVLDLVPDGFGFLRVEGLGRSRDDVYVTRAIVRRLGLRRGDEVAGRTRRLRRGERHPSLARVETVNGRPAEEPAVERPQFATLTAIHPVERLRLRCEQGELGPRMVDLLAPLGRGQRCLIAAPPGAGATTLLRELARAITREDRVTPLLVLVDTRPEEVTDWARSVDVPIHAAASDRSSDAQVQLAELALERAKRLVEQGEDVVLLLDSISRLARAHSLAQPRLRRDGDDANGAADASGVQAAKRWLSAARNTEEAGSLTIVATAHVTPGPVPGLLHGALLDVANMELALDPELARTGHHPALDMRRSHNRRERELVGEPQLGSIQRLRRSLIALGPEQAWSEITDRLRSTQSNDDLLASI